LRIKGLDLEAACRLGAATAALVATGLGSDAGVIDRGQVAAFMTEAERLAWREPRLSPKTERLPG
jgi:hypothetical protein